MFPRSVSRALLACLGLTCNCLSLTAAPSDAPTIQELFRSDSFERANLSPDGRHLGAIVGDNDDRSHLVVINLSTSKADAVRGGDSFDITSFRWLNNERVLFNVSRSKLYAWGLYAASIGFLDRPVAINDYDATRLVGVSRNRPGRILVWIVQSAKHDGEPGELVEYDALHGSSLNDKSSQRAFVRSYPPPTRDTLLGWTSGHDGELALCATRRDGRYIAHRYSRAERGWSLVNLDWDNIYSLDMDPDPNFVWIVTHSAKSGYELRRCSLETGVMDEPLFTDPDYDLGDGQLHFSEDGKLAGITYTQRQMTTVWFSPQYTQVQATIDQNYPETTNVLIDRDDREQKFLFLCSGPQHPGAYVLLDLEESKLQQVKSVAPHLAGKSFSPVQPVSFFTRDKVRLEGYLTLPPGASAQSPVPLVVLAHGGPWVRDTPSFDPEVQFLAGLGYAVLQPNYRGSSGYAKAISHEDEFNFRRMHDDVTDATRAIVTLPMIDRGRVAIMGASFGGYLALAGVAYEDDLYRCAITTCGVFDWEQQIKSKQYQGRPGEYERLVAKLGKPGSKDAQFAEISPLTQAERVRVPVFIAHGIEDNVVEIEQSKKLAAVFKKARVPHETFFRKVEGHGFYNYKNRVEYYRQVQAFLAKHLSPSPGKPAAKP
jgi:dipeptidyl aminopeptidase/acylaminoacyl peptidase